MCTMLYVHTRVIILMLVLSRGLLTVTGPIFNERAARRSRSTSRFGCLLVGLSVPTCA